ncbi:hypothetical protein RF11_04640 [Thelohanellus kitauei]|uniref:Uncharacterized protein n=1 Tax=Thelohanellus kitauei TaxID=669202 RepID=A0A0C2JY07_THEKT|nr:hypothetical protein RF11_04640 [Thelohanellus kitauei]
MLIDPNDPNQKILAKYFGKKVNVDTDNVKNVQACVEIESQQSFNSQFSFDFVKYKITITDDRGKQFHRNPWGDPADRQLGKRTHKITVWAHVGGMMLILHTNIEKTSKGYTVSCHITDMHQFLTQSKSFIEKMKRLGPYAADDYHWVFLIYLSQTTTKIPDNRGTG